MVIEIPLFPLDSRLTVVKHTRYDPRSSHALNLIGCRGQVSGMTTQPQSFPQTKFLNVLSGLVHLFYVEKGNNHVIILIMHNGLIL